MFGQYKAIKLYFVFLLFTKINKVTKEPISAATAPIKNHFKTPSSFIIGNINDHETIRHTGHAKITDSY